MVTVTLIESLKELNLDAHFFYKDRIKEIPGAHFSPETKSWRIPVSSLYYLENNFKGELFFNTPKWYITNSPPPDYSKAYQLSTNISLPTTKLDLFDYQKYGVKFIVDRLVNDGFCILGDGVGLGKTPSAITTVKWLIENKGINKILIVVKKSVKTQWMKEFDKFTDISSKFKIVATGDTPKKRKSAYDTALNNKNVILITNYHNFLTDEPYISLIGFDMSCVDEVHQICGRTTKMNNAIARICQDKPCVLITGTPIMSQPENIFGIVQIAKPKYFGQFSAFKHKYLVEAQTQYGLQIVGAKNLDELRDKIQRVVLRRTEKEVSVSLPTVRINKIDCKQDSTQKAIIEAIQKTVDDHQNTINNLKRQQPSAEILEKIEKGESILKGLLAAKQAVATDPRLFFKTTSAFMKKSFAGFVKKNYTMSDKTEIMLNLVQDIVNSGGKVIIFSKFWTSASLAAEDIKKQLGYDVLMYTGQQNKQEIRDECVQLFTQTTQYNVLIGTEALSEGVNLQEARYIINIDQPDTFAIKTQRIGRVRRVSSKFNTVMIYDLITEGSKDVDALKNINENVKLTDALINLTEEQSKALIKAMTESNQ